MWIEEYNRKTLYHGLGLMLFRKLIQIWKQGVLSWFFNLYIFLYFSSSTNVAKKYCKDLSNIQGARRLKMHALEVSIWRWEGVDVLRTTSQYQYGWFFGNLPNIPWPLPFGKICCKFSGKCWHFRFPWFYFVVKCCLKSATQFFGWKMTPPPLIWKISKNSPILVREVVP